VLKIGSKSGRLFPDTAIFQNELKINPKSSEKGIQKHNFFKVHKTGNLKQLTFIYQIKLA